MIASGRSRGRRNSWEALLSMRAAKRSVSEKSNAVAGDAHGVRHALDGHGRSVIGVKPFLSL